MPRGSQKSFWLRLLCSNSAISARHCSRVRCNRLIVLPPFKLNLVVAYGFKLWLNRCGCCYGYLNVTSGDNILGLLYLIPHREIFFASPDQDTVYSSVPFDYSGQYLTINGEIKIGSQLLENSVMCIDSGAKESIISKSIYKSVSVNYSNIKVDILNYSSPFGERRILAKRIPNVHILVGNKEANFSSIPVATSSDISLDCDIVLGMDFLKNIVSLNFITKTLRIK